MKKGCEIERLLCYIYALQSQFSLQENRLPLFYMYMLWYNILKHASVITCVQILYKCRVDTKARNIQTRRNCPNTYRMDTLFLLQYCVENSVSYQRI